MVITTSHRIDLGILLSPGSDHWLRIVVPTQSDVVRDRMGRRMFSESDRAQSQSLGLTCGSPSVFLRV